MKSRHLLIAAAAATILGLAASSAAAQTVNVAGTANPWDPTISGNPLIDIEGSTGPTIVAVNAGDHITINYLSGLTNAFNGGSPTVDGAGYVGGNFGSGAPFLADPSDPTSTVTLTGIGSSGFALPSGTLDPTNIGPDVWLNALIGDFVDGTGLILGSAFVVNNGPLSIDAPTGAVNLQLGLNDDIFGDNSGSLLVQVLGSTVAATSGVPEPATWGLMLSGFGLAGAALRARRRLAATT